MPADFDFSEVLKLAADLDEVPETAGENVRKAVTVTARNVKDGWRKKLSGSQTLPGTPRAISYDVRGGNAIRGSEISAEIGADLGGQGSLVWVDEYGSPTSAPRGSGAAALHENERDFIEGLSKAIGDVL